MAFMAVLESDLRALSAEARRRYPAVKDGAEHAILKLRSLSSPSEIAHNEDILRIFLMACEVRSVKLSVIGLSCLQKLISHDAVAPSALKEILSTLKDVENDDSASNMDLNFRIYAVQKFFRVVVQQPGGPVVNRENRLEILLVFVFLCDCVSFEAGCADGSCIIWDFETRGIAKELHDKDCVAAITSVCWSKDGRCILVSAADKSLTLWDVISGEKITRTTLQQTPLQARLHPGSSKSLCLACPLSSAPMIVDLNTGSTTVLPVSVSDTGAGLPPPSRNKFSDGSPPFTPTAACFNKYGDLVYVGNSKGEILIVDHKNKQVRAVVPISGGSVIKNIVFSRNGQYLLTNSNDRTIRIYENLLPLKDGLKVLDELSTSCDEVDEVEKLKAVGSKCLALPRDFQDSITKVHWKVPCFSGDGEWIVGGSASKGEHKIYIWDRAGHLVKILEGPKEALIDLAWHPVHPIVVSVSLTGLVYIWAKDYTENWSAFAPDFKELEENEEYIEREDEFDLMPETEKVKDTDVNEDDEVDIMTVENESAFSDSDMSQEELCFLPAVPCPDVPEQQDKCVGSTSKLADSNHSGSPLSEEAGQNGQAMNHASSPVEEDTGGTRLKRKRKPSEKGMELQAEKVRKPLKTMKSSGKLSKIKNKPVVEQDTDSYVFADDVTDEYH